ncbi:hypothetical protein EDB82DRAFT_493473 [Fusarium venenatum]|uniref:uncharacterized protein n=1 Tax=Fusarium venenatum TaxID=56646 RepID=UPI001D30E518|nr:hypothetical protein EDB82DRAFT_493473 [Fusarium venenatum]
MVIAGYRDMASSSGHGQKTMTNNEPVLKPEAVDMEEFEVENNPFKFTPGQLGKLFNPKSLADFYKLGGLAGIEKGLRLDRTTGLSIDEESATNAVTFEEETNNTTRPRCPTVCEMYEKLREKRVSPKIDNSHSLAVEVKNVHSRLVAVQAKCTEIEQGRYRNNEKNSDLSPEQWDTLEAISRTLLDEGPDLSIASPSLSPRLQQFRKIAYNHSLRSRNLHRFNDCLLPLLRREQDLESAQQWLEMMRLSSSLLHILGKNELIFNHEENELLDTIDQTEDILMELMLWFRHKYKSLTCKKEVTEEQSLVEVIFEFPNNIRHTCTTMPWTISPALLVLWGVCWMFIIGTGQPGHEELKAANSLFSPLPAVYDFYGDLPDFDIGDGPPDSILDDTDGTGYDSKGSLGDFMFENIEMVNDPINALTFSQSTPQDPNFLFQDLMSRNDTESLGLLARDSTGTSSAAAIQTSILEASPSTGKTCASGTDGADGNDSDHRKTGSEKVTKRKTCFVCPSCKQTFATSFTLTRHQTEVHQQKPPSSEKLFPCPNPGCKKSTGKSPFKRGSHLKRHLNTCKHHQEFLHQPDDQTFSRLASSSTLASQLSEVETEQAVRATRMSKRLRVEDDEGSDELLLARIWKKYNNMKEEVKQKRDAYLHAEEKLKAFGKNIQDLTGSLSDS